MAKLAPSLLAADFSCLGEQISQISGADMLHLDIMDGNFVPNITFGPEIIKDIRKDSDLTFDSHLMISDPARYIDAFAEAGSDIITFHVEATDHSHRVIQKIKNNECGAGIALNPNTPLTNIEYLLPQLDLILIMSVNPGFGGQKFIPIMRNKIARTKDLLEKHDSSAQIAVDGGIKPDNVNSIIRAGADIIVAGSAILGRENPETAVKRFKKKMNE